MMVSIMLISFTLLAGAFMLLSYRYIIGETRDSVKRNAGYTHRHEPQLPRHCG